MKFISRNCPVCGSKRAKPRFSNVVAPLDGLDMSYHVASCSVCGFIFANKLASFATYDSYYRTLSKYDQSPPSNEPCSTDVIRANAIKSTLRLYFNYQARIADLGCGSGMLLGALIQAGWSNLMGLDPAPGAPEHARNRYGLDCVSYGTLEQAPTLLNLPEFDLLCLTGVLEHLPRLRKDLITLTSAAGPQTHFLIEVPAFERSTRKRFEPYGEFSLEHIQFFTVNSLAKLFKTLGYSPLYLALIDLPIGDFDSILGLFVRDPNAIYNEIQIQQDQPIDKYFNDYIKLSECMIESALTRIKECQAKELIIYCAGSHTARLLPRLEAKGENRVVGLIDSNKNLHGKYLGSLRIDDINLLSRNPEASIIISSFRSQSEIASKLQREYPNPLVLLY